jgi:hypothetical protein
MSVHITPRSDYLPHNSFILRNNDRAIKLRFIDTKRNYCSTDGSSAFQCFYREENEWNYKTEHIKEYAFTVNYPEEREYCLKPYEALTVTIIGGLQPPNGLEKACLLKAVRKPRYNFTVQPLEVQIHFEYIIDGNDEECNTMWNSNYMQIYSTFTKQLPMHKCAFGFDVSVSRDPVELIRCCMVHSPIYDQNIFPYFPHDGPIPITGKGVNCTCCQ